MQRAKCKITDETSMSVIPNEMRNLFVFVGSVVVLYLGTFHLFPPLHCTNLLSYAHLCGGHLLLSVVTKVSKSTLCLIGSQVLKLPPYLFDLFLFALFLLTVVVSFTFYFIGNLSVAVFIIITARVRTALFKTSFNQ